MNRLEIAEFLNKILMQNSYIFINYWSIIHFFSGALIMSFLLIFEGFFKRLFYLFLLLGLWEFFEFTNYYILENSLFRPEIALDVIWDLGFGMSGGLLILLIAFLIKEKN